MDIVKIVRQAARSMKTYDGLDQVADAVAVKVLTRAQEAAYRSPLTAGSFVPWLAAFTPAEPQEPLCKQCGGKGWVTPSIKMYPGDKVACSQCAKKGQ